MARRIIENVRMGPTWTSYIAAAHGILKAAGMYDGEIHHLMGESGIGFHFIVHREACPSSVTVYDWTAEHLLAMDRLGVHTDVYSHPGNGALNTASLLRRDAVDRIRSSVDGGRAVLVWAPTPILEFGIIRGYDDADGVFFVVDCTNGDAEPLLYDNLGKSQVPILFYQVFREKARVEQAKIQRDSLAFGLSEWKKEWHVRPDYASGRKGYEHLVGLMKRRTWNEFGLAYLFAVYASAKRSIATYLDSVAGSSPAWKPLGEAASAYAEAAANFGSMSALHPFAGQNGTGGKKVDEKVVPDLIRLAEASLAAEEKAFTIVEKALAKSA